MRWSQWICKSYEEGSITKFGDVKMKHKFVLYFFFEIICIMQFQDFYEISWGKNRSRRASIINSFLWLSISVQHYIFWITKGNPFTLPRNWGGNGKKLIWATHGLSHDSISTLACLSIFCYPGPKSPRIIILFPIHERSTTENIWDNIFPIWTSQHKTIFRVVDLNFLE